MWKLILRILEKWGCHHKWERYHRAQILEKVDDKYPYKSIDTLICKNCGKIKKINL